MWTNQVTIIHCSGPIRSQDYALAVDQSEVRIIYTLAVYKLEVRLIHLQLTNQKSGLYTCCGPIRNQYSIGKYDGILFMHTDAMIKDKCLNENSIYYKPANVKKQISWGILYTTLFDQIHVGISNTYLHTQRKQ